MTAKKGKHQKRERQEQTKIPNGQPSTRP